MAVQHGYPGGGGYFKKEIYPCSVLQVFTMPVFDMIESTMLYTFNTPPTVALRLVTRSIYVGETLCLTWGLLRCYEHMRSVCGEPKWVPLFFFTLSRVYLLSLHCVGPALHIVTMARGSVLTCVVAATVPFFEGQFLK